MNPLCTPKFWEFLKRALQATKNPKHVIVITNGLIERTAISLAKMARKGMLYAGLSYDEFHIPKASNKVLRAFTAFGTVLEKAGTQFIYHDTDYIDQRFVNIATPDNITKTGRALENGLGKMHLCCCPYITISKTGRIYECGCNLTTFGTLSKYKIPDDYKTGVCSKVLRREKKAVVSAEEVLRRIEKEV